MAREQAGKFSKRLFEWDRMMHRTPPAVRRGLSGQLVRLGFESGLAVLEPPSPDLEAVVDLFGAEFTCRRRGYERGGQQGYREIVERVVFFEHSGERLLLPPGLFRRAVMVLERHGYAATIAPMRAGGGPMLDRTICNRLPATIQRMLEAIDPHRHSLVAVADDRQLMRLVRAVLTAFSRARVLIPLATPLAAERFRGQLRNISHGNLDLLTRSHRHTKGRFAVADLAAFDRQNMLDDWDLVVLPEALTMLGKLATTLLWGSVHQRIIGLASVEGLASLSPYRWACLEAVVGPVVHVAGLPAVPMTIWAEVPFDHRIRIHAGSPLEQKRAAFWHNDQRNTLIVQVALAAAHGDEVALRKLGVKLRQGLPGWKRVTILAESLEHARQLHRYLRGWTLSCAGHRPRGTQAVSLGTGNIVTAAFAEAHGITADVLIRVDGGVLSDDWPAPLVVEIADRGLKPLWRRQAALTAQREPFPSPWGGSDGADKATPSRAVSWLKEQYYNGILAPARLVGPEGVRKEQEGNEGAGGGAKIPPASDDTVEGPGTPG